MNTLEIKGEVNWENLIRIKIKKHGWRYALGWIDILWMDGRISGEECKRLGEMIISYPGV